MKTCSKFSCSASSHSFQSISKSSNHFSVANDKYTLLCLRQKIAFLKLNVVFGTHFVSFFQFRARADFFRNNFSAVLGHSSFQTKIVCSRAGPMDAMNNFAFVSSAIAFRYARAFGGRSANLRALSVGVRQPSNST